MIRLLVNNEAREVDSALKTWGELLARVEADLARQGRLVTAARLDGVDEPSFRAPEHTERALDSLAVVELEVSTPSALVVESLREALDGLNGLRTFTLLTAGQFRGTKIAAANQSLADLSQGLRVFVSLVEALVGAMGVGLEDVVWDGRPISGLLDDIGAPIGALADSQIANDWVTVADILEFDLEPALGQSEPFFRAFADLAMRVAEQPRAH
jgi:hypothetical protein